MSNLPYSRELINISTLMENLSKTLDIESTYLTPIKEKLEMIILPNNTLDAMLKEYTTLLESEMANLIVKRITPSFQYGIKNKYFSFIGYHGKFNGLPNSVDITEKTFFSFDSISKILTSVITMLMIRDGRFTLDTPVHYINPEFMMDASIESILKFTAMIQTEKRIESLSPAETIDILKRCRENVIEKSKYKNYYKYNDIGYMILRLAIPDFLERLDTVLSLIDSNNLTYKNIESNGLITGGRLGLEHFTPDLKGRGIIFPGHTGLYGNIEGLINLFEQIFFTNNILTKEELDSLLRVPYMEPNVYNLDGTRAIGKNGSPLYMAKTCGIYRTPEEILGSKIDKMASCDFSNLTTNNAMASAGTCGSWVMGDNLSNQGLFGSYIGGILTSPYTLVNQGTYPEKLNQIPNTNLTVNQNGVIQGYSKELNPYKEIITEYGIILELLTAYYKYNNPTIELAQHKPRVRKLKKASIQ